VIVVSDTNILSSLAAGDSLPLLLKLFARSKVYIPPSVRDELQTGLDKGRDYLGPIFPAIAAQQIEVIPLSSEEEKEMQGYPRRLNLGERQAIALARSRNALLLSNDRHALRYCQEQNIRTVNLVEILRLLWTRNLILQDEVRTLVAKLEQVENLVLTQARREAIFAPRHRN
jgi:predicted nucleic acid-binding protein